MAKYRKKPVVVDAIQWTGENLQEIKKFTEGNFLPFDNEGNEWYIKTLEGNLGAEIGSYIIKGVKGEFYACEPDIFAMTYEREPEFEEKVGTAEWYGDTPEEYKARMDFYGGSR